MTPTNKQENSFKEFYQKYFQLLCYYVNSIVFDLEVSKDICQEAFVEVWHSARTRIFNESLKSYLFLVAKNKAIDLARKKAQKTKYENYSKKIHRVDFSPEQELQALELEQLLQHTIDEFPEKTKEIYFLQREDEKSIRDISISVSLSEQSVKWHLAKIKKAINQTINSYFLD